MDDADPILNAIRHASCCGKRPYKTMRVAELGIVEIIARYGDDGYPLFCYYCAFCNFTHIGRKPKPTTIVALSDLARMLRYGFSEQCTICVSGPKPIRVKEIKVRRATQIELSRWADDGGYWNPGAP